MTDKKWPCRCEDQQRVANLIAMLTDLFNGLEAETIDKVVAEAKKQATAETGLAELFNSQIEILKSRGCPQVLLNMFRNQKREVLNKAAKMDIPAGNIPFVPVIPRFWMGIYGLMPMVKNGDEAGYTYLDPNEIVDNEERPNGPYYIYDVELGKATLGKSPEDAEKIIKAQDRLCHVPEEDIAIYIFRGVLSDHYLWSAGSRYGRNGGVPCIVLSDSGRPELDFGYYAARSNDRFGSASCRSRG